MRFAISQRQQRWSSARDIKDVDVDGPDELELERDMVV